MRKILVIGAALAALVCVSAGAQNPVMRGEVSPGVYANVKVDSSGIVSTSGTSTSTISGNVSVVGNVAAGATDSGNPVKTGGVFNTTLPTYTATQRGDLQIDANGILRVRMSALTGAGTDAFSNTLAYTTDSGTNASARLFGVAGYVYNGATWDRQVGTTAGTAIIPAKGTMTDRSGTITSGGTAQQIMAANASRRYLIIQNISDTTMWCNFTTTAVAAQPSFQIIAGATFAMQESAVSTEAVSCIGATTGKGFTAKEM